MPAAASVRTARSSRPRSAARPSGRAGAARTRGAAPGVAGGSARAAASSARNASSCAADGRSPCHKQPGRFLERGALGQLADRIPGDDRARRARRRRRLRRCRGRDDAFESAVDHRCDRDVAMYDSVNVDSSINMNANDSWMTVPARLRGLLASAARRSTRMSAADTSARRPAPGPSRERCYSRDDVERLRRRTEERRDPDKAAAARFSGACRSSNRRSRSSTASGSITAATTPWRWRRHDR